MNGKNYSFVIQGGTYRYWEMWAYDFNGSRFDLRWHVKSTEPGFAGNRSSSHTVLVVDIDGDGLDEINNGCTMLGHDGSVLGSANECFDSDMHVNGQVIDDIDPINPGLEVMMHAEWGNVYALFDSRNGRLLWKKEAPGTHLQLNVGVDITGSDGLDIVGTCGGHQPQGGFACKHDGTDIKYPFQGQEYPINGDRIWPMDWDIEVCFGQQAPAGIRNAAPPRFYLSRAYNASAPELRSTGTVPAKAHRNPAMQESRFMGFILLWVRSIITCEDGGSM